MVHARHFNDVMVVMICKKKYLATQQTNKKWDLFCNRRGQVYIKSTSKLGLDQNNQIYVLCAAWLRTLGAFKRSYRSFRCFLNLEYKFIFQAHTCSPTKKTKKILHFVEFFFCFFLFFTFIKCVHQKTGIFRCPSQVDRTEEEMLWTSTRLIISCSSEMVDWFIRNG